MSTDETNTNNNEKEIIIENNETFKTEDIVLASVLMSHGIRVICIARVDEYHSSFTLEKPSKELLDYYLAGRCKEKQAIDCYRHLLADSRKTQRSKSCSNQITQI